MTSPEGLNILDDISESYGADLITNIVYKEIFKGLRDTNIAFSTVLSIIFSNTQTLSFLTIFHLLF